MDNADYFPNQHLSEDILVDMARIEREAGAKKAVEVYPQEDAHIIHCNLCGIRYLRAQRNSGVPKPRRIPREIAQQLDTF